MRQFFGIFFSMLFAGTLFAQDNGAFLAEGIRDAEILILGEVHDNPLHHDGQAVLIRQAAPTAVVFEMLTPEMAQKVNAAGRDDLAGLGDVIGWEAAGWPDFDIYLPVFEAMGDAQAVGAAMPRGKVRAAFDQGAAAVFGPRAAQFGLYQLLPLDQLAERTALQFEAHCQAMPMDMMSGMIEAQRLRDAAFSDAALRALDTFGAPVVVITGYGHARRDWGMPYMISRAAPELTVYSVGFTEEPGARNDPRFDVTFVTPATPRDDPCAAFEK